MARRNPFAAPEPNGWQDKTWDQVVTNEDGNTNNDSRLNVPVPVDYLPPTVNDRKAKKRDREWDKKNKKYSYRGIPLHLHEELRSISERIGVTLDDVARAFLEYGLRLHHTERIEAEPVLNGGRLTLYPNSAAWTKEIGWAESNGPKTNNRPTQKANKKKGKGDVQSSPSWRQVHGYRIPEEVHNAVKGFASELSVPIGEVVRLFFQRSFSDYQTGLLALSPKPKTTRKTLFPQ